MDKQSLLADGCAGGKARAVFPKPDGDDPRALVGDLRPFEWVGEMRPHNTLPNRWSDSGVLSRLDRLATEAVVPRIWMIDATYRQIVARATTLQAVIAALKRRDAGARNNPGAAE